MSKWIFLAIAFLGLAGPASGQGAERKATPLFAAEEVLEIGFEGPFRDLLRRAETSTDPYPATMTVAGESYRVEVSARGKSRRQKARCSFPPLRVSFPEKPAEGSLFHRQGRLKLVTHCNDNARSEQHALREYAAYRVYNAITPESFRVRLARITYTDKGKPLATRHAFFIEDADDAARRNGMKEVDIGNIPASAINPAAAARYAVFQYMIGNTDWAINAGPDPKDCCHNSRLFGAAKDATGDLTPVPYDFDSAGIVDAPYAVPSEKLNIPNVKVRVYRGHCAFNAGLDEAVAGALQARPRIEEELESVTLLDDRTSKSMARYLESFFEILASPQAAAAKLAKACI